MKKFVLFLLLLPLMTFAQKIDTKTYIPPQAFQHFDTIKIETLKYFPELKYMHFIPGLIEHESCISLKHSKCWNSESKLDTKRELGIGLGQLTKAYHEDGSIRFDSLEELRNKHMNELKELSWSNIRTSPQLQIRAILLMNRDNYMALHDVKSRVQRTIMMSPSYNGGMNGLQKERRICALAKDCDPGKWFDNVEKYCSKSKKPLYAGRSACDINRHHPHDIVFNRMPKYKQYFE
jgi:hypothetical protein